MSSRSGEARITARKQVAWVPVPVGPDGVPLSHGQPMTEVEPGLWMDTEWLAMLHHAGLDHNYQSLEP